MVDLEASYYRVLSALSQDIVRLVRHMLHEETSPNSQNNQRTSLMASHSLQLSEDEEDDELPTLGDRKPSAMSAKMLEYCLDQESSASIFAYFYIQRLLREIHVLLSKDDHANMWAIADKADRLTYHMHVLQGHDTCTAIAADEEQETPEFVAASQVPRDGEDQEPPTSKRSQQQQKNKERRVDLSCCGQDQAMGKIRNPLLLRGHSSSR